MPQPGYITVEQLEHEIGEARNRDDYIQCAAVNFTKTRGGVSSSSFCRRNRDHEGDHRGYRSQWPR
jgi:hypothetical protein